jgi:1-acyl-sn-glycerol-3-phosphate acyltransferase
LYLAADQADTPLYFMTAWQVFSMSTPWERYLMQRLGCFSVDRESSDRQAYKQAVEILRTERVPVVIFPEGDIFHVTDRVTPFREGAAAIAISAARRSSRPTYIVPCAIKFFYLDDPTKRLAQLMFQLEERLLLRPLPGVSLTERIYRFADGLLALKEIDFLGRTQEGALPDRITYLTEEILARLEGKHGLRTTRKPVPERVKELRQRIIQRAEEPSTRDDEIISAQAPQLAQDMEALFFAMQLYSYPGDYLTDRPSIERLAETLDKFEEDVLQRDIPSVHGRRRVTVRFGPPIEVRPAGSSRGMAATLTQNIHAEVQNLMNELCEVRCDTVEPPPEPVPLPL